MDTWQVIRWRGNPIAAPNSCHSRSLSDNGLCPRFSARILDSACWFTGTLQWHSLLVRVCQPDSPVEGRVWPFRLHVSVRCQPTSWEGLKFRFVRRCSGSPLDVARSEVTGLAGPATRLGQLTWVHKTWRTHDGQVLRSQAPWGCGNRVETMTRWRMQSTQESDSGTWTMRSAMIAMVISYVGLWQWGESNGWRQTTHKDCLQIVGSDRGLHTRETQGSTQRRRATNGVDERHLDDLAQRKRVGIHNGPLG